MTVKGGWRVLKHLTYPQMRINLSSSFAVITKIRCLNNKNYKSLVYVRK